jgi:hypothetical protein
LSLHSFLEQKNASNQNSIRRLDRLCNAAAHASVEVQRSQRASQAQNNPWRRGRQVGVRPGNRHCHWHLDRGALCMTEIERSQAEFMASCEETPKDRAVIWIAVILIISVAAFAAIAFHGGAK